ncbi:endonuclease domain-containing protein [Chryseobacterium sp. MP_3.2]|uniref:endonuclease domain-containing protein n=1 Tax=Chryseobacterium sp. MP_3.2 TaxID=3071712 RepID=UPI002DFB7BD4|nr:hypothetical protein [Chryseobacterium sp. MP_3.2]
MARIPISIEKIIIRNTNQHLKSDDTITETVQYLLKLIEKGTQWEKTITCHRDDLLKFRNEIDKLLSTTTTSEILNISIDKAKIVDEHYRTDPLCQNCSYKLSSRCKECLFILQSPLERQLFLSLLKSYIKFETQYPLNWQGETISIEGKTFDDKFNNFKEVLTVVDFFIEKRQAKLCVYTDGHTYHERTEEQAKRDRNIDRKLQELGFTVLRYTGKEVKENPEKIISEIKRWTV